MAVRPFGLIDGDLNSFGAARLKPFGLIDGDLNSFGVDRLRPFGLIDGDLTPAPFEVHEMTVSPRY